MFPSTSGRARLGATHVNGAFRRKKTTKVSAGRPLSTCAAHPASLYGPAFNLSHTQPALKRIIYDLYRAPSDDVKVRGLLCTGKYVGKDTGGTSRVRIRLL